MGSLVILGILELDTFSRENRCSRGWDIFPLLGAIDQPYIMFLQSPNQNWRKVVQWMGTHHCPYGPTVDVPVTLPCSSACFCLSSWQCELFGRRPQPCAPWLREPLSTIPFGIGLCNVLPLLGVVVSGQEHGKQDLRDVFVFTCLTRNASKTGPKNYDRLCSHKSLWF